MRTEKAIELSIEWLYDASKGPIYVTTQPTTWDIVAGSVALFLEQDFSTVKVLMEQKAQTKFGPGWYEELRSSHPYGVMDIVPKSLGGKGIGVRDLGGVWDYLIRMEKRGKIPLDTANQLDYQD